MGLALDYGSEEEEEEQVVPPVLDLAPAPAPIASTSSLGLPPPKKKKRALKIGFDNPLLSAPTFGAPSADDEEERSIKRQRVEDAGEAEKVQDRKGKGKSTLLDMLPPPKRTAPVATSTTVNTSQTALKDEDDTPLVPRKLAKQAGKIPTEPASLDLFGLASTPDPASSISLPKSSSPLQTISSAPAIQEYIPPPPSLEDPYPGYYQHPVTQAWHAYPEEVYKAFIASTAVPSAADQGAVGRGWEGVEGAEGAEHVDVRTRMENERREREKLKKVTAPHRSAQEATYKDIGRTLGRAGQKHQLSALLKDAQANRVALEERFARDKRTKKESGTKYGF
ncbi:hypothetical protein NliqN6_1057 [Naganishia liquefaciens]|uniref:Mitotic checkpoint regulator, MAD2B-interacting-domain-containing protein n=1 Tax=Naganishia liquefaciens TaxID=104408 RepID=A0A8H3YCS8_9TREE|nr:hypothetical protein NliqN6_1057 [Naganishia liquefaciens]